MRTSLRLASSAFVAGLFALSPAFGQTKEVQDEVQKLLQNLRDQEAKKARPDAPKNPMTPEAELKRAQDQLQKLLQELREQEAKKARPDAPKNPGPPMVPPGTPSRPMVWNVPGMLPDDPNSTLKGLLSSKDPAVVSGDGTVTVFDVVSGKELMKFPGKK